MPIVRVNITEHPQYKGDNLSHFRSRICCKDFYPSCDFERKKIESSPLSTRSNCRFQFSRHARVSWKEDGRDGRKEEVWIGEKRVRRCYGVGCPLGETFNRLVANAFKMAGLVRSALIAAERIRDSGRVASSRFMDSLGRPPVKLSCLSRPGLRVPEGLCQESIFERVSPPRFSEKISRDCVLKKQ